VQTLKQVKHIVMAVVGRAIHLLLPKKVGNIPFQEVPFPDHQHGKKNEPSNPELSHAKKKTIIAKYDYTDENGNLLYQVVRYDNKEFMYRRPDGKGDWIWNLGNIRPVPYRLDEVVKSQEVVIVEGEKDVERLRKLGFAATTSPMGAGKWRSEYNHYFKGKDVIIIADNDDPGRKHAADIAQNLLGIAKSIKIIDLTGCVEEKGDVSDYLQNKSPKDLQKFIRITAEIKEKSEIDAGNTDANLATDHLVIRLSDVKAENVQFLWSPYIPIGKLTLMEGDPGVGKSFLALAIVKI